MANHQATGKKSKHGAELVQRSRAAILNALDVVETKGKTISQLLAAEFIENPIRFMELASKFAPKELDVSVNPKSPDQMTDAELYELIEESRRILRDSSDKDIRAGAGENTIQ